MALVRAIALGTSAAYPGPDNACSGWLVQEQTTNLLIDCGTGVLAKLQRFLPLAEVSAIVISHMHADHFFDLVPLRYAFKYALKPGTSRPSIFLPPQGHDVLRQMMAAFTNEDTEDFFLEVFTVREYDPDSSLQIGTLKVSFAPGVHYVPCWAIAVEGERKVVFTSDTGPSDAVTKLARGAHLLVSEATYLSLEEDGADRGHLTAREAGELAARANPQRVLLTHLWPNRDPQVTLNQAKETFHGDMALAETGRTYAV